MNSDSPSTTFTGIVRWRKLFTIFWHIRVQINCFNDFAVADKSSITIRKLKKRYSVWYFFYIDMGMRIPYACTVYLLYLLYELYNISMIVLRMNRCPWRAKCKCEYWEEKSSFGGLPFWPDIDISSPSSRLHMTCFMKWIECFEFSPRFTNKQNE